MSCTIRACKYPKARTRAGFPYDLVDVADNKILEVLQNLDMP